MTASLPRVSGRVFVETPEQMELAFEQAGLAPRLLAYLIDLAIRVFGILLVSIGIVLITGGAPVGLGVITVLLFLVEWGYFTVLEWRCDGVTPGKRALGLRVVRTNGVPLDLYRSAMRNLLRAADGFPPGLALMSLFPFPSYALGALMLFLTGGRRLGDLVADTMVIRVERIALLNDMRLPEGTPLSPQRLERLQLTAHDLAAIGAFLQRRHCLTPARTDELASLLAKPIRERLPETPADPVSLLASVWQAGTAESVEQRSRPSGIGLRRVP